jgi:hypothetical protein
MQVFKDTFNVIKKSTQLSLKILCADYSWLHVCVISKLPASVGIRASDRGHIGVFYAFKT